jgi:hypothetical protein
VLFLQLYNTVFHGAFWPFFTGSAFQLIAAVFQFARMILLLPEWGRKRLDRCEIYSAGSVS